MISIRDMFFEDIPRLSEIYRQFWNEPCSVANRVAAQVCRLPLSIGSDDLLENAKSLLRKTE